MQWDSESGDLWRSVAGVNQIYSDNTTSSLRFNAFAAYPIHVVQLTFTKRREK